MSLRRHGRPDHRPPPHCQRLITNMRKVAVTIEQDGPSGQWKLVGGPTEDVTSQLELSRELSKNRGGGNGTLLVLSTVGIEKRLKIGPPPAASKSSKVK